MCVCVCVFVCVCRWRRLRRWNRVNLPGAMCVCNCINLDLERRVQMSLGMKLIWNKHCSFSLDNSCFQLGHDAAQDVQVVALVGTGECPYGLKEKVEACSLHEQLLGLRWVKLKVRLRGDPMASCC